MVDNTWAYEIETKVLGLINSYAIPRLKKLDIFKTTKFTNAVTNEESRLSGTIFPTIYVHELAGVEQGKDLEGQSINAVLETFQIDCITNTKQSDAKQIMRVVSDVMKELRFEIVSMPEFKSQDKVYRSTARFRRVIGRNDRLKMDNQ
nr:MAG TPA: PORTAL PROTEIN, 15 PROTEIN, HEAD PROTEIN, VIRAL INFECTION, TAILED.2A [Bacteriophage sp.]DAK81758.1 MAG TPA: PORTAL PROTEIN, 15 PROTEIN, HEAD PROTEIN, VIRAL INFECTION, TAILED.2A [Bacteriophage sp.]